MSDLGAAICDLVAVQLGRRRVALDDRLVEDLGVESVDRVNLVAAAEDRWSIEIEEEEIAALRTVGDLLDLVRRRSG